MKKVPRLKRKMVMALAGVVSGMLLVWNCSHTSFCKTVDVTYDEVYSDTLKVEGKDVSLKVSLNSKDCTDGLIQIDNQKLTINPDVAKTVGYAQGKGQAYDFTGDGKEEIALILSGGASGSVQAVQVFGNEGGTWKEIAIPSDVYSDIPGFLKEQQNKLDIKMDSSLVYYRTISFENQKILVTYLVFADADTSVDAEICKELIYSSDKKEFVLGNTVVIPTKNKCSITVSATKKTITVKWNTNVKKSSIKEAQIKVATKKNMKKAKTYKFSKKKAQKKSYKFTLKSGKITKNKKYYFKVRLKLGETWTKWSDVQQAKIKR